MATRWGRVLRGVVASCFAVFVAAFAHVAGGGATPGMVGVSLSLAFSVLACIALTGRRLSRVRMAASVVLSQGAFHLLFAATSPGVAHGHGMAGMDMAVPALSQGAVASTAQAGGWMLAAHALAAVVTIAALVWGERAFWSLWTSARLALARALRHVAAPRRTPRPSLPVTVVELDRRLTIFLRSGLRHRGPPAALAASV